MAWDFINVSAGIILPSTINNYTPNVSALGSFTWSGRTSNISNAGTDIKAIATSSETLYTTNMFGISLIISGNGVLIKLYYDNTAITSTSITGNYGVDNAWLTFVFNDETEQANCLYTWYDSRDSASRAYQTRSVLNNASQQATISHSLYLALKSAIIPEYTWSSVPAISGKNGKYTLTKILNINDGEPVDNITNKGNLDFSKKTKVNTLVADSFVPEHREDATKALAKYEVQNKVYSYCTLVYKKGEIPNDVADGTAIQIDPDGDEVAITGLEENKTYYFVIFTNKTTSEPYRFRTGHNAPIEGIFKIRIATTQGVKDNDFKEVITITQQ